MTHKTREAQLFDEASALVDAMRFPYPRDAKRERVYQKARHRWQRRYRAWQGTWDEKVGEAA